MRNNFSFLVTCPEHGRKDGFGLIFVTHNVLIAISTLCLVLLFSNANAQVITVKGKVVDKKVGSLPGATIALLNQNDSTVITSAISDADGLFLFTSSSSGSKLLKVSFLGFKDYFQTVELNQSIINVGNLSLEEKSTQLNELNVIEDKIPVQTNGDTIQFNADAFKVNRDATAEDLAVKMPGIETQEGKIQAQGEEVKKVLIDGKPFLGDDPNAAMKNLPAEAVDKIQVFDKKSDQAEFTGFDDGNSSKTINIITRPEFRNGTFGRAFAGYGTDDLYKSGASINSFKDKRKLTFLGNFNNINDQNFASDDLLGVIGTNASSSGRPRGRTVHRSGGGYGYQNDANNFLVDQKDGIITTYAGGLNYVNTWNKLDLSASYFYNQTQNNLSSIITRNYFSSESEGLIYRETNSSSTDNFNHRINMRAEYKFDSLNSILFQPKISYQKNNNSSSIIGINSTSEGPLSVLESPYSGNSKGYNISTPILYRHKFSKIGRTISINLAPTINESDGDSKFNSITIYTADTLLAADTLNQNTESTTDSKSLSSDFTFTEAAGKNGQLSIEYHNNYSLSSSDMQTYSSEILDSSLSNKFESKYITHTPKALYKYQNEKWNVTAGVGYQLSLLKNEQTFPQEGNIDKQFNSILPSAILQYKFTKKKSLNFYYRSSNNAPSISQLQNVINNNNPLQLSTGNPDLTQDWQNYMNLKYISSNSEKNTSYFVFINFKYTSDYIGSSVVISPSDTTIDGIFLTEGAQLTRPVNLNRNYSSRFYTNYSFPLTVLKSTLSLNARASLSNSPGMINSEINYSQLTTGAVGFSLSSNISEKIDFLLSANGSYNNVSNSLQTSANSEYYYLNWRFRTQVMPFKGIVLQTDFSHNLNTGLSTYYNQNYFLWNASAGYKFLANQQAELRLSIFDILKQNKSITRNTTDLYYEDVETNVLKQYWMLTFTYTFKKFVGQK